MTKKKKAAKAAKKNTAKKTKVVVATVAAAGREVPPDVLKTVTAAAEQTAAAIASLIPEGGFTPENGFTYSGAGPAFVPHPDSPTAEVLPTDKSDAAALAAAINASPPTGADAAALAAEAIAAAVKVTVLDTVDGVLVPPVPCCRVCGGEMKSNVCPADGYHLVDAP